MSSHRYTTRRALLAGCAGVAGLALNLLVVGVSDMPGPTTHILVGGLFPMVIALAWGWRYALLAGLISAAPAVWLLWHGTGWGVLYAELVAMAWYAWHGWWAEQRERRTGWYVSVFAVELPFRIAVVAGLYLLFRNSAAATSAFGSTRWVSTVVLTSTAGGYAVILAAYVALNVNYLRRWLGLAERPTRQDARVIFAAAVLMGVGVWLFDTLADSLIFYEGTFWHMLLVGAPGHELYIRSLILLSYSVFGVLTALAVTHRTQLNERIGHINRVLASIRNVNQLITHEKDRTRLLQQSCRLLTESDGFHMAWIGLVDHDGDSGPLFHAYNERGFAAMAEQLRAGELPHCAQMALETGGVHVIRAPAKECDGCPLVTEDGQLSALTVRLEHDGRVLGWLNAIVPATYADDAEQQELLAEVADDIAYALWSLEVEQELSRHGAHLQALVQERTRAIQALRESEQKYRAMYLNAPLAYQSLDAEGRLLDVNPMWLEVLGYEREEVLGKHFIEFVHPDEHATLEQEFAELIDRGFMHSTNRRLRHKDGHYLDVLFESRVAHNPDGTFRQTYCVFQDISERRRAEAALRESESKMISVFRAAPIGIGVVIDRMLADVNERMCEITGYSRKEMIGQSARMLYPSQADFEYVGREKYRQIGERGTGSVETHWRRKDGAIVDVLLSSTPLNPDDLSVGVTFTALDITDRNRAERERTRLEQQFHQAQKLESIGRLAGGVAHDFNNLLMGIMNCVELCRDGVPPDHPVRPWLDEIAADAQRSASLTRQLLAFARKQAIAPQVLDLNDTIAAMLKMLRRLIGEDVNLAWIPGANVWPVYIDPSQVDQILANLAVNARDAIEGPGAISIATENVELDALYCTEHPDALPGEYVMLAVSDDGQGMTRDILTLIFEPFFTTKEVGKGTGLGLATVHGIVKQNNGFVSVYSEPGQGTTFRIHLPRYAGAAAEEEPPAPAAELPRGDETILLVEDEQSVRITVEAFLRALGYTVLVAASPAQAVGLADTHNNGIDMLITDEVMPGMSGRELADRLTRQCPGLRCLFMSGYATNIAARNGVLAGDIAFLSKPFSRARLAVEVRRVLDQSPGESVPA